MYASLTLIKTSPGKRDEAAKIPDQIFPIVKGMKGFKSAVYFGDDDNNEYGGFYVWETKEDLEAAYSVTGPKLQEMFGPLAVEPPVRKVFEVYEPKT